MTENMFLLDSEHVKWGNSPFSPIPDSWSLEGSAPPPPLIHTHIQIGPTLFGFVLPPNDNLKTSQISQTLYSSKSHEYNNYGKAS